MVKMMIFGVVTAACLLALLALLAVDDFCTGENENLFFLRSHAASTANDGTYP